MARRPGRPKTKAKEEPAVNLEDIEGEDVTVIAEGPKRLGRPPMGLMEKRYGLKPGDPMPLHIANKMVRDREREQRDITDEAIEAATGALEVALKGEEKPRSGKRVTKNLRAPVETPKEADNGDSG